MKLNLPTVQSIVALGLSLVLLPTNVAFSAQNSSPQPLGRTPYLNTSSTTTASAKTTISPQAVTVPAPAPAAGPNATAPRDMKLLIIGLDGNEPDFAAVKFFLDTLGIPYDIALTLDSTATPPVTRALPPLDNGVKGYYQGIFLTNGNLGYCYGATCQSTLTANQWASLDTYALNFGVRTVAYYAFPEARYGLTFTGTAISATDAAPETIAFTSAAASIFPYLNTANPLKFTNAYVYLADAVQAAGETTTPLMTLRGKTVAALHTTADGREYMGLTLDNNPYLLHSMALGYGILNWLTKGIFIGGRKVYMTPQVDDHFLPDDQYVNGVAACTPSGFVNDPTYDPAGACPSLRITGGDLKNISDWQTNWNKNPQFARFKVTCAFNGFGTLNAKGKFTNDSLVSQTKSLRNKFFWVTHTWDHEDLDCYGPVANAGASTCVPANYSQSAAELTQNIAMAKQLMLPLDAASIVTPGISGLKNPAFLQAAVNNGIRYAVSDTSKPEYLPAIPNTGIRNPWQPSILMIPRRPTNIFYNTTTGLTGKPGSLPEEYNYFFGPNGIFKIGGTNTPFFTTTQTYANIIDRESDNLLSYLLRYEIYPQMYHQSNLYRYSGSKTLFTDVIDAAFNKFSKISNLPVISLTETDLGRELEAKMAVVTANVQAVLTPGQNLTVTGSSAANVVVTGVCFGTACESYGSQCMSKVPITSGAVTTVPLVAGACAVNPGVGAAGPGTAYLAVSDAQTALSVLTVASTDSKLQDAIDTINDALDPAIWFSPTALGASSGQKYFDSLKKAANTLEGIAKDKKTPAAAASAVQEALVAVATASQKIANDALTAAVAAGVASKNLNDVQKEIANGDKSMTPDKYDTAIDHYGKAWTAAVKAIDKLN